MWLFDKLLHREANGLWDDVQISPVVAQSIQECLNAFYSVPSWGAKNKQLRLASVQNTLTNYLATLCTTEMDVNCGNSPRAEWLNEQLKPLLLNMQKAVQLAAAGGQLIIRPYVADKTIQFDFVQAGRFFPTRFGDNGKPEAGFFCDYYDGKEGKFVRIESFDYKRGELLITNRVYRNQGDVLSAPVSLEKVPKWAELPQEFTVHNVQGPLFGVIKMPFPNTVDDASMMPISLYANALHNIEEFDVLYTEYLYEYHSGKRKRIVERDAVRPTGKDKMPGGIPVGITYKDMTTDTYLILDSDEQREPFRDYTPTIRSEDYLTGLKTVMAIIENQCYVSPGTLAIDDRTGVVTATQIISNDRTTYNTCNAIQQQGMEQGLLDTIYTCDVLADLYGIAPPGAISPGVSFGDSIFEDTNQEYTRQLQMVQAGILRPEKLLAWYFHIDEDVAREEYLQNDYGNADPFGLNSDA